MGYQVYIILFLMGLCCLIAGPVAFFMVMRLFDRVDRLEDANNRQSETLKQLAQLCQSLKSKSDEQERLARLQQLSQQDSCELRVASCENSVASDDLVASGELRVASEEQIVEAELVPAEAVVAEIPEVPPEPIKPVTFFLEIAEQQVTPQPVAHVPLEVAMSVAKEQAEREETHHDFFEPRVSPEASDFRLQEEVTDANPEVQSLKSEAFSPKVRSPKPKVLPEARSPKPEAFSSQWLSLELLIGRKVLPWVASGLFLLFAVFLIQYAFEKAWITEIHKVIGMGLLSAIFLGVGKYFAVKRLRYFATALTSAGISIAFLTGYATYGFYHLLPMQYATAIMSAVVVGSFLLSRYYVSRLLGIVSIIAGLAVPMLLQSETDQFNEFFSYLILLNVGTVVLINVMKRPPIAVLAFVGTQIEFWLWYRLNYEPEKIQSVIIFQAAFYFVYLIDTSLATLRPKQRATWDDAMRAIISPALFYGTSWFLLHRTWPEWTQIWIGIITFTFAAWYAILAVIYARRLSRLWNRKANDELKLYWTGGPAAATVMSLSFLALAIPLHFEANAIMVGWITIGSALWCFGNLLGNRTFVNMSVVFLLLGTGRMIGCDILHRDPSLLTPLLNSYAMPVFCAGLVMCAAGCFGYHILKREEVKGKREEVRGKTGNFLPFTSYLLPHPDLNLQFNYLIGYFGLLVAVVMLSIETFEYFHLRPGDFIIAWGACSIYALTVLWAIVGLLLLTIALACKTPTIRVASMIMFGIVACKLLIVDLFLRTGFHPELEPIINTVTIALACVSLALIALPTILRSYGRPPMREIRFTANIFRLGGVIAIFVLASMECYYYFLKYPQQLVIDSLMGDDRVFFAHASLSVLWGLIALVTLEFGMYAKMRPARVATVIILALAGIKIVALELFAAPVYGMSFANPYFLTILVPSLVAMIAGVWATRLQSLTSENERNALTSTGICGLLLVIISSSFECWHHFAVAPIHLKEYVDMFNSIDGKGYYNPTDIYRFSHDFVITFFQARAALAVFWSIWAIVLFTIGMTMRSQILRVLAMLLLTLTGIFTASMQLFARPDVYETALANPYFLTIAFAFMTMILLAIWGTRLQRLASNEERGFLTAIGLGGLGLAWGAMTVECYSFFHIHTEQNALYIAHTSVTVFWTVLAILIALIAHATRSKVLRYASVVLLGITLVKILPYELWHRPGDFATLLNPFMLSMLLLSLALMARAVIATRVRPTENVIERHIMFALGLAGLTLIWVALSDECFRYFKIDIEPRSLFTANASLTVFWTLLAVTLLLVSQGFRSVGLRVTAIVLLMITFFKAIPLELLSRPGSLEPLLNPYMPVLTLLSVVMIGVGILAQSAKRRAQRSEFQNENHSALYLTTEQQTGQVLAFAGLALLFVCSSIECHDSVRSQIGDEKAAWVAQMAISMLWSVFAGVLVFVGIVWRSAALRWVAILLFAVTTFKVVINDMADFDRIYRIGAFFVLALVMMLAAWAYQRFKPEKPM